jgi:predicted nucleic-acid-binding protein
MRAVDTNVLVRLLVRDDARQAAAADEYISNGAWVSKVVLVEAVWVMGTAWGLTAAALARAIQMVLDHEHLTIEDVDTVTAALAHFRKHPGLGFADCLIVEIARKAGHLPLGTFDRRLGKLDGVERI